MKYSYAILNSKSKEIVTKNKNRRYRCASIVKVSILMAVLYEEVVGTFQLSDEEKMMLESMITKSDNESASYFWDKLGGKLYMDIFFRKLKMFDTKAGEDGFWGLTKTTVVDQLTLLKHLITRNQFFSRTEQEKVLSLLEKVVPEQRWGYDSLPEKSMIFLKNGWSDKEEDNWRINNLAIVRTHDNTYAICIMSIGNVSYSEGVKNIEEVIKKELVTKLT